MKDNKRRDFLRIVAQSSVAASRTMADHIQACEEAAVQYHEAARRANRAAKQFKASADASRAALSDIDNWTAHLVREFLEEGEASNGS